MSRASSARAAEDAPVAAALVAAPRRPAPAPTPPPAPAYVPEPVEADSAYGVSAYDDAVADVSNESYDVEPPVPTDLGDLVVYSDNAHAGRLTEADREALTTIDTVDPDRFTRARALLYLDAKARSDVSGQRGQLMALMALPDNGYKPEWVVEEAQIALESSDYATALERATFAERHWARLPPALVFSRKTLIYEIQAQANTGLFYASEGDDIQLLLGAIRAWEKYRRHVGSQQRQDLIAVADKHLYKLQDMQRRLE